MNTAPMPVTGQCHCGQVKLAEQIHPHRVFICHCVDCQVLTGSAFRVVSPALPGTLQVQGQVTEYARTADSGAVRLQAFCPNCGTPLYARSQDAVGMATLRVGALDQRRDLPPVRQLWRHSALPWVDGVPTVPCSERQEGL